MIQIAIALTVTSLLALQVSGVPSKTTDQKWKEYKQQYQKVYKKEEVDNTRKSIFAQNLQRIQEHNQRHAAGQETYTLGINKFSDLTFEEFSSNFLGTKLNERIVKSKESHPEELKKVLNAVGIPDEVDWVKAGAVTPVKNQLHCESCWAFSATGSIEGQYAIKRKQNINLSEQQLVDCSDDFGNFGCNGGLYTLAFDYIKANGGIESEKSYPYAGYDTYCDYSQKYKAADITGYVELPRKCEKALTKAIATVGPIAVAIYATNNLMAYNGGVLKDKLCKNIGESINHGVLAVGYGVDSTQGPYYLVKNSWGPDWGLSGYFKLARNDNNMCNIAFIPSYPLVAPRS